MTWTTGRTARSAPAWSAPGGSFEPAVWDWYVTVDTYQDLGGGSESLEAAEEFLFLSTEMDPREVVFRENTDCA